MLRTMAWNFLVALRPNDRAAAWLAALTTANVEIVSLGGAVHRFATRGRLEIHVDTAFDGAVGVANGAVGMSVYFEELDFRPTPMGVLSLRRRRLPSSGVDIYEIKLGDAFLMSSQFTVAEIELARLGLAALPDAEIDVVVGGLGLGYTAQAVLENPRVRSLVVVEALAEVIEWHQHGLIPLDQPLTGDPRCRLVHGDFFAMSHSVEGFDPRAPARRLDAVLVDIDHSPQDLLHPRHAALYQKQGLENLAGHLNPGGVFALWSNDPPDEAFSAVLAAAFATSAAHVVMFENPLRDRAASNTVYVAVKADLSVGEAIIAPLPPAG
jgi:spermidine synthase